MTSADDRRGQTPETEPVVDESTIDVRRIGARFKARRRAVELLFEAEARDLDPVSLALERDALAAEEEGVRHVAEYARVLVTGVAEQLDRIDDTLVAQLADWSLSRLPAVDRAILRIGVYELFHAPDVPPAVVVDEAVLLARTLSTADSPRFVNGVLGALQDVADHARAAAAALPAETAVERGTEPSTVADGAEDVSPEAPARSVEAGDTAGSC